MPITHFDAIMFTEEPPEFDYKNGLFHIVYISGSFRLERVMLPHTFMRMLKGAAECARKHRFGGADIIKMFPDSGQARA